jgi:histidine phosphotransferase ChpT
MSEVHNVAEESTTRPAPPADLASRLASRICHDLTSPLGAIANGVELLVLSGTERTPEIDLIADSVESANARLRFFRLAYGAASQQPVSRSEVVRILSALARGSRHVYDWGVEGDHPRIEVKAVFLLLQCLETALPLGGRLCVERDGGSWVVTAAGPRVRNDLQALSALGSRSILVPSNAAEVQFALLAGLLAELGRPLALTLGPDGIEARF